MFALSGLNTLRDPDALRRVSGPVERQMLSRQKTDGANKGGTCGADWQRLFHIIRALNPGSLQTLPPHADARPNKMFFLFIYFRCCIQGTLLVKQLSVLQPARGRRCFPIVNSKVCLMNDWTAVLHVPPVLLWVVPGPPASATLGIMIFDGHLAAKAPLRRSEDALSSVVWCLQLMIKSETSIHQQTAQLNLSVPPTPDPNPCNSHNVLTSRF